MHSDAHARAHGAPDPCRQRLRTPVRPGHRADPQGVRASSIDPHHLHACVELFLRCISLLVSEHLFPCLYPCRKRTVRKAEGMVQYHLARCPLRGVFESPEYARAEELKQKVKDIEAKARKRWEANLF